ncbi:MAG: glycosyltransferase, partial [Anaerolineae bacterium]
IVWNHRWEYDKQPEVLFEALYALESAGIDFRVTVLGESFRQRPEEFLRAQERLHDRLFHFGNAQFSRYSHLLWLADIQVSTAIQDFFGISTCEAIWCGCTPLLPNRLNYPALIPEGLRTRHLYDDPNELVDRLKALCRTNTAPDPLLAAHVRQFDWRESVGEYDRLFDSIIQAHQ